MIPMSVTPNLELNPWTDVSRDDLGLNPDGQSAVIERAGLLPNATEQGRPCVELLVRLPDGRLLVVETTLRLFRTASAALLAAPVAQMEDL